MVLWVTLHVFNQLQLAENKNYTYSTIGKWTGSILHLLLLYYLPFKKHLTLFSSTFANTFAITSSF